MSDERTDSAAPVGAAPAVQAAQQEVAIRWDGLMTALKDLASYQGTSQVGRATPAFGEVVARLSMGDTDQLYRTNWLARRIVDKLPDECTRRGFAVRLDKLEPGQQQEPLEGDFRRLGLMDALNLADKLARKDGGSAIYLSVRDGRTPDQPIDWSRVQRVELLHVCERWFLEPIAWQNNLDLPDFGEGLIYRYQPTTVGGGIQGATDGGSVRIHRDRLLFFRGATLPRRLRDEQSGWDDSVLEVCWRELQEFRSSVRDIGQALRSFSTFTFAADMQALVGGPNSQTFLDRLLAINLGLGMTGALIHDKTRESVSFSTRTVSGMPELVDRQMAVVSSSAGMSQTMLFGDAPGGLSTDDAAGRTYWYNQVSDRQRNVLQPRIERVAALLFASKQGPTKGTIPAAWSVVFAPLYEPTDQEQAETQKTRVDGAKVLLDMGALATQDVAAAAREAKGLLTDITPVTPMPTAPAAEVTTEPQAGEAQSGEAPPPADGVGVQATSDDVVLNGAQVESLMAIVMAVGAGTLPRESATAMLTSAFRMSPEQAEQILGPVRPGSVTTPEAAGAMAPTNVTPTEPAAAGER